MRQATLVPFGAHSGLRGSPIGGHIVCFYNVEDGERMLAVLCVRRKTIRRWDRLLDKYLEECRARGVGEPTIRATEWDCPRFGLGRDRVPATTDPGGRIAYRVRFLLESGNSCFSDARSRLNADSGPIRTKLGLAP